MTDRIDEPMASGSGDSVVIADVRCGRCGYAIKGLAIEGRCPECGLEVLETLRRIVDPTASRLPAIRNPRAVGNGLVALVLVAIVAFALASAPAMGWSPEGARPLWLADPRLAAAVVAMLGLVPIAWLAPPRGAATTAIIAPHLVRIIAGIALWSLATAASVGLALAGEPVRAAILLCSVATALGATTAFLGFRDILREVGLRSQTYRTSHHGRQRVRDMIAAIWGIAIGNAAIVLGGDTTLGAIGQVVEWTSGGMLAIGLGYLLVNVTWIRRSLRRPPPPLRDLIGSGLPPEPPTWMRAASREHGSEERTASHGAAAPARSPGGSERGSG